MTADCRRHFACACMIRERAKLEAEVKRLRVEVERLRELADSAHEVTDLGGCAFALYTWHDDKGCPHRG